MKTQIQIVYNVTQSKFENEFKYTIVWFYNNQGNIVFGNSFSKSLKDYNHMLKIVKQDCINYFNQDTNFEINEFNLSLQI